MQFRSYLFSAGYAVLTVIISIACITVFWFLTPRKRFFLYALWCRAVLYWLRLSCGISHSVEGLEHVPDQPAVVLSNHQSTWETIYLYQLFSPASPILKKELLKIPFWGWALRLQKPIAIDRSKPREAGRSLMTQGAARLKEGLSIIVFPEGTRARPGKVGRFSRGGAQLAVAANAPVVPVVHNAGHCWPAGTSLKKKGHISVVIGEPITTAGKTSKEVAAEYEAWVKGQMPKLGLSSNTHEPSPELPSSA